MAKPDESNPRRRWRRERRLVPRRPVKVGDATISYLEQGDGRPVVFLHGGLASAALWTGVMAHVAPVGRAIALDLVGSGDSRRDDPAAAARAPSWTEHVEYLDRFLDAVDARSDITLVMHGWGSIVGLAWAKDNEERVAGLVNIDSVTRPMAWTEVEPSLREVIKTVRKAKGAPGAALGGDFTEHALDSQLADPSAAGVIAGFRRGLQTKATRDALAQNIAALPIGGRPPDAVRLLRDARKYLVDASVPKLLVLGRPGWLLSDHARSLAVKIPGQTVAAVDGGHLLPLESPDQIGVFLSLWLQGGAPPPADVVDA